MGVTNRLVFDPTDADSVAASSSMGAYVRAGSDGDLIASQTISAEEWLNTAAALFDGSGNAISSTGGALDVNIVVFGQVCNETGCNQFNPDESTIVASFDHYVSVSSEP